MVVGAIASPELHVIGCVSVCVSPVWWDRLQSYVYCRVNIKWHFNPRFAFSHAHLVGRISAFNWQVYVLALVRLWWLMKQLSVHPICGWNQHPAARCLASTGCYHCCQLKLSHQHEMVLMDQSLQSSCSITESNGFHTSVSLQASY